MNEKRIQFILTRNILYLQVLHMLMQDRVAILSDNYRLPLTACSLILLSPFIRPPRRTTELRREVTIPLPSSPPLPRRDIQLRTCNFVCINLVGGCFIACSKHRKYFGEESCTLTDRNWTSFCELLFTVSMANCLHKYQYISIKFLDRQMFLTNLLYMRT